MQARGSNLQVSNSVDTQVAFAASKLKSGSREDGNSIFAQTILCPLILNKKIPQRLRCGIFVT
jgi:hypothetical protein